MPDPALAMLQGAHDLIANWAAVLTPVGLTLFAAAVVALAWLGLRTPPWDWHESRARADLERAERGRR